MSDETRGVEVRRFTSYAHKGSRQFVHHYTDTPPPGVSGQDGCWYPVAEARLLEDLVLAVDLEQRTSGLEWLAAHTAMKDALDALAAHRKEQA